MQIGNIANTFAEIASFFEFVLGRVLNHSSYGIVLLLVTLLSDLFAFVTTLNQKNSKFPTYALYILENPISYLTAPDRCYYSNRAYLSMFIAGLKKGGGRPTGLKQLLMW